MQISIVKYKNHVGNFRLDPEAYLSFFYEIEKLIKKKKYVSFKDETTSFKKGIFEIKAECYIETNGVPFVRIKNLKDMLIDDTELIHIPIEENIKNKNTYLKKNDIILSKTAYPAASLVNINHCNSSQDTIAIKLKNKSLCNSLYIVTFLNCKYGFFQMKRWFTGNIQMHLNLKDSKKIIIPVLNENFQKKIKLIFNTSILMKDFTKKHFQESKKIILIELGLSNLQPKHKLTFQSSYSESQKLNRLDAEYFQPKYEVILNKIKNYKNGYKTIKDVFKQNKGTFENILEKEYDYIEIGSINILDGNITPLLIDGIDLPANAKINLKKGDVLISKVRPYRGAISIVDNDKSIGSGAFTVLQETGVVNKETLMVYLKSKPMLDFSMKFNSGTSYPTITDNDILNFPIPIFDPKVQKEIKENITQMYKLKKQSKQLLEIAKTGVEKAIEENEEIAMDWMNQEIEKLGIELQ